ncbi:DUF4148 domain-containing protein [Herbaspirillum chlorophenolicum]|uniref:DUF4148 domain-containing protein n=1 Tax=Herbaspirillum chlorophenolicum TaxID=211589 RepID=A0ABW8ETM0_9BURK
MKTSSLIFGALATVFSVSAFAQATVKTEAERDRANLSARNDYPVIKFESTKTRADVLAELAAARGGVMPSPAAEKPSIRNSPMQGKAADPSLYNGA